MTLAILWSESVDNHGITLSDALYAIQNYVYRMQHFDEPRAGSSTRPELFIGTSADRSTMLDVMVVITPPANILVFHDRKARQRH